ncbi:Transcriptional regulator [Gulosibacter molinativorax]|nr:Transcriptional regulator [Gulosibacter molinativorax]
MDYFQIHFYTTSIDHLCNTDWMRSTSIPEVPIELDRDGQLSLPLQLARAVRELIDRGALLPGDELPSTRAWAARLGVSRGTVVSAYEQLTAEGYLTGERGSATRINPRLRQTHPAHEPAAASPTRKNDARTTATASAAASTSHDRTHSHVPHPIKPEAAPSHLRPHDAIDMLPGRPATDWLHTPAWRRAWRVAADAQLASIPLAGDDRLRGNLAEHFRRMRGLARDPDQFLVTAGGREGLALIIQTLASELEGGRALRVGVESPGYPSLRRTAQRLGAELVALEVDHAGLRTDMLPVGPKRPDLVIVTPSHQYPLGGSLPIDRRIELLEWARREQVLIVEDDYDSELRYVGQPLPTLTALDDSRDGSVALLGTFSTTVAPSLGIGMLCVSDALRERLLATRRDLGTPVSALVQHAFAEYLASGELRRHTARMRRTYRQRRGLVLEALGDVSGAAVSPMDGGLHAVIRTKLPEAKVLAACEKAGVLVSPGADYWRQTGRDPQQDGDARGTIVIGYAHLSSDALSEGLRRLRGALGGCD